MAISLTDVKCSDQLAESFTYNFISIANTIKQHKISQKQHKTRQDKIKQTKLQLQNKITPTPTAAYTSILKCY